MDQIKIGKFIASCRREKNMTQQQLADVLGISDKTVSKWECGRGLPEVQFMIPLCDLLGISVNELLSGERLSADEYQKKAEENMMALVKEKEYVKTYKPLAGWYISFILTNLFFGLGWYSFENVQLLSKVMILMEMALIDILFVIIFKGEYVYWIVYGPDFETAKNADSQRRQAYAWKYLRTFFAASLALIIYLSVSTLFHFPVSSDFIASLVIIATAAFATVPIRF